MLPHLPQLLHSRQQLWQANAACCCSCWLLRLLLLLRALLLLLLLWLLLLCWLPSCSMLHEDTHGMQQQLQHGVMLPVVAEHLNQAPVSNDRACSKEVGMMIKWSGGPTPCGTFASHPMYASCRAALVGSGWACRP